MNQQLVKRITELFELKLQSKTGWGKNEVFDLYKDCVIQATLEFLDK